MDETKKGSMCCGGCCDMRRAVIILNTISIILVGLLAFIAYSSTNVLVQNIDDDAVQESFEDALLTTYILIGIGIAASLVGIWGAYSYNILGVGFSAFFIVAFFITDTVRAIQFANKYDVPLPTLDIATGALIDALLLYPHVGLIAEIKNGTMTPETYPREQASCCCV